MRERRRRVGIMIVSADGRGSERRGDRDESPGNDTSSNVGAGSREMRSTCSTSAYAAGEPNGWSATASSVMVA